MRERLRVLVRKHVCTHTCFNSPRQGRGLSPRSQSEHAGPLESGKATHCVGRRYLAHDFISNIKPATMPLPSPSMLQARVRRNESSPRSGGHLHSGKEKAKRRSARLCMHACMHAQWPIPSMHSPLASLAPLPQDGAHASHASLGVAGDQLACAVARAWADTGL